MEALTSCPDVSSVMKQEDLVVMDNVDDGVDISQLEPAQKPAFADRPPIEIEKLPDPKNIVDQVAKILKRSKHPDIQALKEHFGNYSNKLEEEFPEFSDNYPTLFKKIIKGEDISRLAQYLHMIQKMRTKKVSVEKGEKELGESLADTYIPQHIRDRSLRENADLLKRAQHS
jgi:hypothetical protein